MAEDKVDSIIDLPKIESELDFLKKNLKEISAIVKDFPVIQTKIDGAKGVKELLKENAGLAESLKAIEKLTKERFASEAKLALLQSNDAKAIAEKRVQIAALNKEQKLSAALNETERNSLGRAQALILQYTNEKKKLNLATEEGRRLNENYNKAIQKSNDFILNNADAETKRTKNIGNYSKSAQIIVDALEKEKKKLEELEKTRIRVQNAGAQFSPAASTNTQISRTQITGFAGGANSSGVSKLGSDAKIAASEIDNLDKQIEQSRAVIEGFSRVTEQPKFLNVAGKLGDATQEVKFFTKSLIELERNGLGNSEAANALRGNLAELTDQISDAKAEVKALSSDTRGFDLFAGSISFAADAFQTAAGAAVLFGASEEDAAAATKTLIAVQSVANGVKGIANELTTRGTAANKVYTFAQNQLSIAMDGTAKASARLRAALITIGIGAIIIGIGLLVANFGKIREALGFANKAQEAYNETLKDYQEGAKEAIISTNKVKLAFEQAKQGVIGKDKALKIYNETLGDAFGKANSLAEAERLYNEKAGIYIQIMGLKAQANALFAKSADEAAKGIVASTEDQTTFFDKLKIGFLQYVGSTKGAVNTMITAQEEGVKREKKIAQERSDLLADNATKIANQAETLAKGLNINLDKPDKAGGKNAAKKTKEDVDAVYEILVFDKKRRIALAESILSDEESGYLERVLALNDFLKLSQDLLNLQNAQELKKKGLSKNEQLVIEAKYEDERIKLSIDGSKRLEDIRKGQAKKEIKLSDELRKNIAGILQASIDDDQKKREEAFSKEQDLIKRRKELYKTLYDEILQTIIAFSDASFDTENKKLEKQKEEVDKKTEVDLAANEILVQSEEEKAENIIRINERGQAQKEQIARKQRALEIQKARFDKATNIANIITETALAVIRALGAKPFTPANIALAAVTGAIGAVQLARAVSVQLPQFKDGLSEDYEGWAITGDGGKKEAHIHKDGSVSITPDKDTLTYIEKGDRIHPDADAFLQYMQHAALMDALNMPGKQTNEDNYAESMVKSLEKQFDKQTQLLAKIANKKELHLTAKQGGMEAIWKWGANQTKYTDENTNW